MATLTPAPTIDDVLAELRAIRQLLESRKRPAPLTRADRARLARLLPVLGAAFGSEPFASRDVLDDPGARVVLRGCSNKAIGKLLARGAGVSIDGFLIERAGVHVGLALWRVVHSLSK
jgi:hypothetical protein